MPTSPNIRFQGSYSKTNGGNVTIKIIDKSYSGVVNSFVIDMDAGGLILNYNTDEKYIYNSIDTMSVKLSIINYTAETQSFFNDLVSSEEGRFYLSIEEGSLLFLGKIIVDEMTIENKQNPSFSFTAIDSITDLKNIEYDNTLVYESVKDIILYCLNKLEVALLYSNSETILLCQSNIIADTTLSIISPFATIKVANYFYKIENDVKINFSCYDVIKELCGRLNCKMFYERGRYNFMGNEGITQSRVGPYIYYAKNGTLISGTSPSNPTLNIDDNCLDGGYYTYISGINEVVLNVNKEWTNRVYESTKKGLNYPVLNNHSYFELGVMLANQDYNLNLEIDTLNIIYTGLRPDEVKYKVTVKTTDLSTLAVVETDHIVRFPFVSNYSTKIKINIVGTVGDKKVEVKAAHEGFSPTGTYTITIIPTYINYKLTKNKETETTYFKAKLASKNVKSKKLNNIASDRYGKDLVKFFLYDGTTTRIELEEGWKFESGETFRGLEASIVRNILQNLRHNQEVLKIGINVKPSIFLDNLRSFEYKTKTYKLISYERNMLRDLARCTFINIVTPNSAGITQIEDIPAVDISGFNTNINIQGTNTSKLIKVHNVTTNTIVLDYDIPSNATFESIENSIDLFVEGVRWLQVTTIGNKRNCYTVNAATKTFTFSRVLDGANVIFKINKNFVSGETF